MNDLEMTAAKTTGAKMTAKMTVAKMGPAKTRVKIWVLIAVLGAGALGPACTATTTTSSAWTDPAYPPPQPYWVRPGRVEFVREVVQRREGNPAGGALAGALIGGFLFGGRGPRALVGAAGGAAVGAAASQGGTERVSFEVHVRFDDGQYGMFVYDGYPPFRPGERVVLTPQGLTRG